ncbi:hypothetical protein LY78DRAFT_497416 [Colletotrichum sublineola]|nr:hypothetical protein LY78DRAFT_497416 [Colletotrichum sublineola]
MLLGEDVKKTIVSVREGLVFFPSPPLTGTLDKTGCFPGCCSFPERPGGGAVEYSSLGRFGQWILQGGRSGSSELLLLNWPNAVSRTEENKVCDRRHPLTSESRQRTDWVGRAGVSKGWVEFPSGIPHRGCHARRRRQLEKGGVVTYQSGSLIVEEAFACMMILSQGPSLFGSPQRFVGKQSKLELDANVAARHGHHAYLVLPVLHAKPNQRTEPALNDLYPTHLRRVLHVGRHGSAQV